MKRQPIGHIRRHFVQCPDCKGLGQSPVKLMTTQGEKVEWRECPRCKANPGFICDSYEVLNTLFDQEAKPE